MDVKTPTRNFLPYGMQSVTETDIEAVVQVLRSEWWTQGETGPVFERALANRVGAKDAVSCSSGTAALHLSMLALDLGPGDAIVTSPNSFLATANCARYVGADVVFADIDPATGNLTVDSIQKALTADPNRRVKAVVPVHFAGQPVDLPQISELARAHGASVVADGCHAIGAEYVGPEGRHPVGNGQHADLTVFSFHPVKHVATGEGGAITTDNHELADRLRLLRNHGMQKQSLENAELAADALGNRNPWYYEMQHLGYNYRLTDIQAALGISQLNRLDWSLSRRQEIADRYCRLISESPAAGLVRPLLRQPDRSHAYHLFVVRIDFARAGISRAELMNRLRHHGVGTQVHYLPIPLQPYYRNLYRVTKNEIPGAMEYYELALSLPMYPAMTNEDVSYVVERLVRCLQGDDNV